MSQAKLDSSTSRTPPLGKILTFSVLIGPQDQYRRCRKVGRRRSVIGAAKAFKMLAFLHTGDAEMIGGIDAQVRKLV